MEMSDSPGHGLHPLDGEGGLSQVPALGFPYWLKDSKGRSVFSMTQRLLPTQLLTPSPLRTKR